MTRALVTGAGGFLGRHAVAALADTGFDVVASGRHAPQVAGALDTIACDLLSDPAPAVATRCDTLVHFAWHDDARTRMHAPENLDWTAATLRLARAFAEAGGKRMVFVSSCAVYDWAARGRHDERDIVNPASLYGAAKASTARLLDAAQETLGLSVAEARVFFAYGAREPAGRLIQDLVAGIAAGQPVPCTDGTQRRDYLHAADIGRAIAAVARAAITGPVNIASGTAIPVADLIGEVSRQMGRPDLPQLGARPRPSGDPDEIAGDPTRLAALGFRPRYDLESGVAELLAVEGRAR